MLQRTAVTHRFIHWLLQARFSRISSLQLVIVDSESRVVTMDVCTNIAIAGILILGILAVAGIIGNTLTFVVFWKGNFKSSTAFLFLSLSLIDSAVLLTVFTCCIVMLDFYIYWLPHNVSTYLAVCAWPLFFVAETATIWVTVLIAANRYVIVCLPLRASQWCTLSKVKVQLAVMLVLVVLYNIPQIFRRRVVHFTLENATSYVVRVELTLENSYPQFHYVYDNILPLVVLVCLPLVSLTLLTVRLIKAMKAHRRMQAEMQRQHSQPDISMTFALVIVVIVFIICRAPHLIWSAMLLLEWPSSVASCYLYLMYFTLLTINSAVNFVIYIFINRRFRNVLFANVCRRRSPILVATGNVMAMSERVTRETDDGSDTRL